MRFDAYCATIRDAEFSYVAEAVASTVQGVVCRGRPKRRFGAVLDVDCGDRMAAWVGWSPDQGIVYVEAKGETTPRLAQGLRVHFPTHTVPRADVCEDYDEPGVFDRLIDVVRQAKGRKVKGGYVALPDELDDGKTWAAGTRGGEAFIRVYEAGKHPDRVHLGRPNWARLEGEFRPHYAVDKVAAARMTPLDMWGLTSWSHRVGELVASTPINRYQQEIRRTSFDKTTSYVARTFRRHFQEMLENGEDISRTFQAIWDEDDRLALELKARSHH